MVARFLVLADPALLPNTIRDPFFAPTNSSLEGFEFAGGWSGTIANPEYPDTFDFASPTNSSFDSFEFADGWSGTT